jgi:hypothetical protein
LGQKPEVKFQKNIGVRRSTLLEEFSPGGGGCSSSARFLVLFFLIRPGVKKTFQALQISTGDRLQISPHKDLEKSEFKK